MSDWSVDDVAKGQSDLLDRLRANDFAYQAMLREVRRLERLNSPQLLPFVEKTAQFAWWSHPGRLADGAIENILLRAGRGLPPPARPIGFSYDTSGLSRTLHVASELHVTGGHSRVLAKWVRRDSSSAHAIVVTRQTVEIPSFLRSATGERQVPLVVLDRDASIMERAAQLRALSADFDRIILHHHPDDATPVLAYAEKGGPPVAMFNHAHFWYSLGSGVSDMTINTMPFFQQLSERYRYPKETGLLNGPFGLDELVWDDIDKREAKNTLGLRPDDQVLMTIGAEKYFRPAQGVDFFVVLQKLIAARPQVHVLVVGVRAQSPLIPAQIRGSGRVTFTGPVSDPRPYYRAADLCLESFPMPSLGALTEAVAYGQAFPVPAYSDAETPLRVDQARISSVAKRAKSEADYVSYVCQLLDAPQRTHQQAGDLRRALVVDDQRFGDQFPALYDRLAGMVHAPCDLPDTNCAVTPDTLALVALTDPVAVGYGISNLPLPTAIVTHLLALIRSHESPGVAVNRIMRRIGREVVRHFRRK